MLFSLCLVYVNDMQHIQPIPKSLHYRTGKKKLKQPLIPSFVCFTFILQENNSNIFETAFNSFFLILKILIRQIDFDCFTFILQDNNSNVLLLHNHLVSYKECLILQSDRFIFLWWFIVGPLSQEKNSNRYLASIIIIVF